MTNSFGCAEKESKIRIPHSWFAGPTHHNSQLHVYMHKVGHGTQQSCGCFKDKERFQIACAATKYNADIVCQQITTIITIVGVSYVDHINAYLLMCACRFFVCVC